MISLSAQTYINHVSEESYAIIKNAVDPSVARDYLEFANSFQYSESERADLLRNQRRLNASGRTIYNVALKCQDALRVFIRGMQGEVLKGLLNEKYYAAIPQERLRQSQKLSS